MMTGIGSKEMYLSYLVLSLTESLIKAEKSQNPLRKSYAEHVKNVIEQEENQGHGEYWDTEMKKLKDRADKILSMSMD